MTRSAPRRGPRWYVIEVRPAALGWDDEERPADRVRAVVEARRGDGRPVRLVRAVTIPEDGSCLLVVEAPSRSAAAELARDADLDIRGLGETVRAGGARQPEG